MQIELSKDEYQELVAGNDKSADEYVADDFTGGFVLKAVAERETGMRSALHKERENARDAKRKLRQFEESGSGEENEALRQHAEELAAEKDNFRQQLTVLQQQVAKLSGEVVSERAKSNIAAAVQAIKGTVGLAPFIRENSKVLPDGTVVPVDGEGNELLAANGSKLLLTDWLQTLREDVGRYGSLFYGVSASGGSTPPGAGQRTSRDTGTQYPARRSQFSKRQKIDYQHEHGFDAYMALPL